MVNDTWTKWGFEIPSFKCFFGDRMTHLSLIDFKIGLYTKVNVNGGQNKFEVHISKHLAKMAINWHKIGQMPLLGLNINWALLGHFSSNFNVLF